jgi:mono/diheme cytochrome c family protein
MRALVVLALAACSSAEAGDCPEGKKLKAAGEALFFGKAGCATCHKVGDRGDKVRGPNLGVGDDQQELLVKRARRADHPGVRYVVESIIDPDAFVVAGYARGVMPRVDLPPMSLGDDDVLALAIYLATVGPGASPASAAMVDEARRELNCSRVDRDARSGH